MNDIWYVLEEAVKNGVDLPKIYDCCGTEDFGYSGFCAFKEKAKEIGLEVTYAGGTRGTPGASGTNTCRRSSTGCPCGTEMRKTACGKDLPPTDIRQVPVWEGCLRKVPPQMETAE